MPELPEVQTIVDGLNRLRGRKILDVWTDTPKLFKKPLFGGFKKRIKNCVIRKVERRGKNILFKLEKDGRPFVMLAHQKMTGHFLMGNWKLTKSSGKIIPKAAGSGPIASDPYNQYVRVIFYLDKGELGLSDLRKFAKIIFENPEELERSEHLALGPDALSDDFNAQYLYGVLKKRNRAVKSILMEQGVVSGVGNIYADEALFLAKIRPQTPASRLNLKDAGRVVSMTKKVLEKALKLRGTSIIDYRDAYGRKGGYDKVRLVYDREGEPCRVCKTPIKRIKIGQRSAHFCPKCQA